MSSNVTSFQNNNVIQINQLQPNDKIIRFLNLDGLLYALGIKPSQSKPTFRLGSCRYYQELEDKELLLDNIPDRYENGIYRKIENGNKECFSGNVNPTLISCWSTIDHPDVMERKNLPFKNSNFAISSTVQKIELIMTQAMQIFSAIPHINPRPNHGKIYYYPDNNCIEIDLDDVDGTFLHCFFKRLKYSMQQEYRFSIHLNCLSREHLARLRNEQHSIELHETGFLKTLTMPLDSPQYINAVYLRKDVFIEDSVQEQINQICTFFEIDIVKY